MAHFWYSDAMRKRWGSAWAKINGKVVVITLSSDNKAEPDTGWSDLKYLGEGELCDPPWKKE